MGVCYCRPQTVVTEDPNVIMHTEAGYCYLKKRSGDLSQLNGNGSLAYVRNTGHLYLEATVGNRFYCPCNCSKESWKLSDISQIEVVDGNITVRIGTRHQTHRTIIHQMNPGLGILLKNGDRILMQMPDAVNFCTRLRQQCNLPTITTSELLLERMLWQAIMNGHMGTTSSARQGTGTISSARQGTGTTSSARQGTGTTSSASQGTSSARQGIGTTSSASQGTDGPEDRQALISWVG